MSDLEKELQEKMTRVELTLNDLKKDALEKKKGLRAAIAEAPLTAVIISVAIGLVIGLIVASSGVQA